jgi:hypothetical protein
MGWGSGHDYDFWSGDFPEVGFAGLRITEKSRPWWGTFSASGRQLVSTRTASDLLSTAFLSHGDTKHIMLLPSSPHERFEMAMDAFNLAEKFQTLVFVLYDLDLGMNNWM